jgi:hypothetical protein
MIHQSGNGPFDQSTEQQKKGFSGHFLAGLEIPQLIQMCAINNFTGIIRVRSETDAGDIYVREGEIVHSTCGKTEGIAAFQKILSWQEGEIHLQKGILPPLETIDVPWDGLLLQTMSEVEDIRADASPQEPISPPKKPPASEVFRLHKVYSDSLGWEEIRNCLIYALDKGQIVRPSDAPQRMRQWGDAFGELFRRAVETPVWDRKTRPLLMDVTVGGKSWVLIPHEPYLLALEIPRGVDMKRLHRRVRVALEEML